MAQGVTGDLYFVGTWDRAGSDVNNFKHTFKIHYSETYDIGSNTSSLTLTAFDLCEGDYFSPQIIDGSITVNGTAVVSGTDTDEALIVGDNFGGVYGQVKYNGQIWSHTVNGIMHNLDGTASVSIGLGGVSFDGIKLVHNGVLFDYYYGGLGNVAAQTVQLTTIKRGLAKIGNGTGYDNYICEIYDTGAWGQYVPYIGTGSSWQPYNGG